MRSSRAVVQVTVLNVNEAPVLSQYYNTTVTENTLAGTLVPPAFRADDPDANDAAALAVTQAANKNF